MGNVNIENLGEIGIVRDMPYHEMPPNAWSSGLNVRMKRNEVQSFLGNEVRATNPLGGVDDFIVALSGVSTSLAHHWFYGSVDDVLDDLSFYAFDGAVHNDITPVAGPLSGSVEDIVNLALINQNVVVTNNIDQPHFWDLVPANPMQIIPGWDSNHSCLGIVAHKGFLIAYNMVETAVDLPYRVRWSDVAPPASIPQSWDAADPALQAGFVDLGDATSELLFGLALRDQVFLYSNNQIFGMQNIGGQFIWRFYTISKESGILTTRCATNVRNNIQLVVSDGDVLIVDGQSVKSVINRKNRVWMFSQMNPVEYQKTFCFTHIPQNEVWICFPSGTATFPDLALVWNYKSDTWQQRDMPASSMALGAALDIGPGNVVPTWASSTGFTWTNPPSTRWGDSSYRLSSDILICGAKNDIHRMETGNQFAGVNKTASVERLGLRLAGDTVNLVTRIWPRMSGTAPVDIFVGGQMSANGPVTFEGPFPFNPGVDQYITCAVNGRTHSIRYETRGDSAWSLQGHEIEWHERGLF